MSIIISTAAQGSDAWLSARKGRITGSRFRDCRDKLKSGTPSKACLTYAMDVARERCGGSVQGAFVNAAMRLGSEQEALARVAYELATDALVEEVGFASTEDGKFGCSVDGSIDHDGLYECKTMVSSDTLFTALVDGDISAYRDQCVGELWLLRREWIDLHLWVWDMPELSQIIRINRDENEIQRLEDDLMAFERLVSGFEARLRARMSEALASPPWDATSLPVVTAPAAFVALPSDLFA